MLYFLYTGQIEFAPFSSRQELPAQARIGDWSTGKPPSPSAKSVYRLADKVTSLPCVWCPWLIGSSTIFQPSKSKLRHTSVTIWSTATSWRKYFPVYPSRELSHSSNHTQHSPLRRSFPEILSMQISQLICKLREESKGTNESITRKQLRETIAALPQSRLVHAADALDMIWKGVKSPLELPEAAPGITFPATPVILPYWHRIKIALLKSIPTGTFTDVQFYAYNGISKGLPSDPRPLFTSSIVIEEWASAITTRKWKGLSRLIPL